MSNLTSKERVMNVFNDLPIDRPPVCNPTNVASVELMDLVDSYFPEAHRNPELNARLASTGYTELGYDCITPYFSIFKKVLLWVVKCNGNKKTIGQQLE